MTWTDLADDELAARLRQTGLVNEISVRVLVERRDTDAAAGAIDRALAGEDPWESVG